MVVKLKRSTGSQILRQLYIAALGTTQRLELSEGQPNTKNTGGIIQDEGDGPHSKGRISPIPLWSNLVASREKRAHGAIPNFSEAGGYYWLMKH